MSDKNLVPMGSKSFEDLKKTNEYGAEYWSAREIQPLLGYTQWRRFEDAVKRALTSCKQSGNEALYHFAGVGKMIDTAGGGIRKMFNYQRERFFPMPEYDLSGGKVKVTVIGKVLDLDFAKVLAQNSDLTLNEIIMLDNVQKKKKLTQAEEKHLRNKKLIEGRKPNYYISVQVAQQTGQKAAYTKNRPFDKAYYLDFIEKAIREHGHVERNDVNELLWNKLPEWMNDKQKKTKINNLLSELRRKKRIRNDGSDKKPKWVLITI